MASRLVLVSLLIASTSGLRRWPGSSEIKDLEKFREFQEFRGWMRSINQLQYASSHDPPPIDEVALMARYIVNQADWTSVATISSRKNTKGYPFVNIVALSDGPIGNGSGVPYLFLTPLDFTAQDIYKDNRATLMVSLAQGRYCQEKNYDPMDPRCARVVFSGKIKQVKDDNPEFQTAKTAMFERHPWLAHMPEDHHFFFAKLKIDTIGVLDTFGGPRYVSLNEYLHPNEFALANYFNRHSSPENDFNKILHQPLVFNL